MHLDDYLVLEDESGRVKLRGDVLLPSVYVTGMYHKMLYDFQFWHQHLIAFIFVVACSIPFVYFSILRLVLWVVSGI